MTPGQPSRNYAVLETVPSPAGTSVLRQMNSRPFPTFLVAFSGPLGSSDGVPRSPPSWNRSEQDD